MLLYDAAYEAYIREPDVPHSIYEIEGAREVAIEFRSFSQSAGFTGTRCAYGGAEGAVRAERHGRAGEPERAVAPPSVHQFGTPYVVQKGAAARVLEGQKQVRALIDHYMDNARIIREGMEAAGLTVYGGRNAPYIRVKTPAGLGSWDFFDLLLTEAHVVGTPGSGFGPSGEGYFRLTAFGRRDQTQEAVARIKTKLRPIA